MGVISTNRKRIPAEYTVEDYLADYGLESPDESENEGNNTPLENGDSQLANNCYRRRSKLRRPRFAGLKSTNVYGQSAKQGLGSRKLRRQENAKLLAAPLKEVEVCDDLSDILPDKVSPFTQLFLEQENMKLWNKFVELTEDEQNTILICAGRKHDANEQAIKENSEQSDSGLPKKGIEDKRAYHPGYSAEACFRRVAQLKAKYRTAFGKRHLPLGKIEHLEEELIDYFTHSPDGVWIGLIQSSFERLLLHSIAEYLLLRSKTLNSAKQGAKETQVENPHPEFITPPVSIVEYLSHTK